MPIELKVPTVGESITEVQIADWLKSPGEAVHQDEAIVALETEKVALDLPAPVSGILVKILKQKGETAAVGEVIAHLEEAVIEKPRRRPAIRRPRRRLRHATKKSKNTIAAAARKKFRPTRRRHARSRRPRRRKRRQHPCPSRIRQPGRGKKKPCR